MLISVCGNVIDTTNIYKITPVINVGYDNSPSGKSFKIEFFNQKELTINAFMHKEFKNVSIFDESDYREKLQKLETRITTLRNEVIGCWSPNQSKIPKLEL